LRDAAQPRILFVPVSGAFGMGEYARSLSIARGCIEQWPEAQLHFVVSRQAPYAGSVPFPATLLDSSPTFHSKAVIELMETFQPTVVVFDNAGRTAQLRAARRRGARVVYISPRASAAQGISLALAAARRRTLDCVSGIHRREPELSRAP
jgi:hypothetical protein